MPDWLKEALANPTVPLTVAGRAVGLSRNGSYAAADRGEIPTLRFGAKRVVATSWLRKVLGVDQEAA